MERQTLRRWTRTGFFILFVLAPVLNIFRLDLTLGHFILFGQRWTLGMDAFVSGDINAMQATINIITFGFIPIAFVVVLGIWISWKYGRLYCGWLCPHFSMVELINTLMRRACGKPTLWENRTLPTHESDGSQYESSKWYWAWTVSTVLFFAVLWAVALLTYLLPPNEIYYNLFHWQLTRNQMLFVGIGSLIFCLEFLFARHLFCRFGCAIGLFQSLAWMTNDNALEIQFDRDHGGACKSCTQACDNACPMRLKPRKNKRHMFTCTQCTRCVDACNKVQADGDGLLHWRENQTQTSNTTHQAPIHFHKRAR